MKKGYWILCCAIFACGAGLCVISEEFSRSTDNGEMPPEFGFGVMVALSGLTGILTGAVLNGHCVPS